MEVIEQIWDNYDKSGDGFLEGEELQNFLNDVCQADETLKGKQKDLEAIIDSNGDGKLSKKELLEIFAA